MAGRRNFLVGRVPSPCEFPAYIWRDYDGKDEKKGRTFHEGQGNGVFLLGSAGLVFVIIMIAIGHGKACLAAG